MKVSEIMTADVVTASPETTLDEVARLMRQENVGSIPVVDEVGDLSGIVTDRDIVVRAIAAGRDPAGCTAGEVLSEKCEIIDPESSVEEAAEVLAREQIRRLPVVKEGRLVGIISIGDIAVKHGDEELSGETLEEVSEGVKQSSRGAQIGASPESDRNRAAAGSTPQPWKAMQGSNRGPAISETANQDEPAKLPRGDAAGAKRIYPHVKHTSGISEEAEVEDAAEKRGAVRPMLVTKQKGRAAAPSIVGRSPDQGVTTHSQREENQRQEKVVPMREDNRVRNKHVSKPAAKKSKTG